jgi:hypothetical protein
MIIYGWRLVQTAKEDIADYCSSCGKPNSLSIHILHRYIHLFWIPLFPIGRIIKSHCSQCGLSLEKKEMPDALKLSCSNIKHKRKIPIWMFSGVFIVGGIIMWVSIKNKLRDNENRSMIENPLKNDLYDIKSESEKYTSYKVKDVKADTVYVLVNQYETNTASGLSDLRYMEYNDTVQSLLRSDLEELFDKGEIINIERN